MVGSMKVEQRGLVVWPLVPVQVLQPGEHPCWNQRHGCPFVSGRLRPASQPPFGSVLQITQSERQPEPRAGALCSPGAAGVRADLVLREGAVLEDGQVTVEGAARYSGIACL